jgi:hypothetical protein
MDAEQVRDEDQVAGRGDRQELGEALDDSKQEGRGERVNFQCAVV